MLKKILIGLVVLVGGFFGFAAMQPDTYTVTRKVQIDAPPSVVFAQINSLKSFGAWNPWDRLDPKMKKTYGKEEGVGATYSWEGNDQVGKGLMTITKVVPEKQVELSLEFKEPFANKAETAFAIEGSASPVTVVWTMKGHNDVMAKAAGIFMNMDKMLGDQFTEGLGNLKTIAEKAAKDAAAAPPPAAPPEGSPAPPPDGAAPPAPADGAARTP